MARIQNLLRTVETVIKGKGVASILVVAPKDNGNRRKVHLNRISRESPKLGHQAIDPKVNPVLTLPLPPILKRLLASTATRKGIGNEAA